MKTTLDLEGYTITVELEEKQITVKAEMDGDLMEEFALSLEGGVAEEAPEEAPEEEMGEAEDFGEEFEGEEGESEETEEVEELGESTKNLFNFENFTKNSSK